MRRKDEPGGGDWREAERAEHRVCLLLPWDFSKTTLISVVADASNTLYRFLSLSPVFNREQERESERDKKQEKGDTVPNTDSAERTEKKLSLNLKNLDEIFTVN